MPVRYFYDLTPDRSLTSDPEGTLVQLCDRCADRHWRVVAWAGDSDDLTCELCDEAQEGDDQ
jgi:hypothetical protein